MEAATRLGGAVGTWLLITVAAIAQAPPAQAPDAQLPAAQTSPTQAPAAQAAAAPPAGENGAAAPALPTPEEAQQRLQEIKADPELAEEPKAALVELWTKLVEKLTAAQKDAQRREQMAAASAAAANRLAEVRRQLENFPTEPPPPPIIGPNASLEELRQQKAEVEARRDAARQRKQELETLIAQRRERRKALPQALADARSRLQALQTTEPPTIAPDAPPAIVEAQRLLHAARLEAAQQEVQALLEESKTVEAEADLLPAQLQLATRAAERLEVESRQWGRAVAESRESEIESQRARLRQLLGDPPTQAAQETLKLAQEWPELVRKKLRQDARVAEVRAEAAAIEKDLQDAQAKVDSDSGSGGELSTLTGLYLQHKRSQLPTAASLQQSQAELEREILRVRSLETELDMRIDQLRRRTQGRTLDPRIEAELQLLQEMREDADKYYLTLLDLLAEQNRLKDATVLFEALIEQSVLWIRSEEAFEVGDFRAAWRDFQKLVHIDNLKQLGGALLQVGLTRPDLTLLWALGTFGLLAVGSRLRRRLVQLGEVAQKKSTTQLTPTLLALGITAVLALPLGIGLALPGWRLLSEGSSEYLRGVGTALLVAAAFALPLELLRQLMRPHGLATEHFNWPPAVAAPVRRNLRWMLDIGLPLSFAWGLAWYLEDSRTSATVGRLAFVAQMLLVAGGLWRILHPSGGAPRAFIEAYPHGWIARLRFAWHGAAAALPVGLAAVSLAGYTYSAVQLSAQLYRTVWLAIGLVVGGGLLIRWSLLSRRRLALAQARQRLAQMRERQEKETGPVELPEEPGVDLTAVNEQTQRLIQTLMVVVGLFGLAGIWASVLPALEVLDRFELWPTTDSLGEEVPVTLTNVVFALPIVILTIVAVRNLPGLLETTVLQQLPLATAVRYAVTTLSSYALAAIGIIYTARALGLRWESIQWLVAALGVGLGFGLQEIFANFVSGIILLFEQPIRVGDVVTIDGTTGVVSKIRIRATTVINWDRQELIIPNKDLITGRLVNWTLSDSMNRVVINVGIAYGSDTTHACETLREICEAHENVVDDPAPIITFEGFGDSALNLVVRCYLKSLDVRLATVHELHTMINDAFRERDIEIAFPQRDLHIRSVPKEWAVPPTAQESTA